MYIDKNELIKRFGQDEIDDLVSGVDETVGDLRIDTAISDAEGVVNSYLSKRTKVPVADSSLVRGFVAHIARYNLYDDHVTDKVESNYQNTINRLKDIAAGRAELAGAADETDANSEANKASANGSHVSTVASQFDWSTY